MALLLQRIRRRVGPAVDGDFLGQHLGRLPLGRRGADHALDGDAATGGELEDLALVVRQRGLGDDLDVAEARAVVEFEEAEAALGIAARAHPALQHAFAADRLRAPRSGHADLFHRRLLPGLPPNGILHRPTHAGRSPRPSRSQTPFGNGRPRNSVSRPVQGPDAKRSFAEGVPKQSLGTRGTPAGPRRPFADRPCPSRPPAVTIREWEAPHPPKGEPPCLP